MTRHAIERWSRRSAAALLWGSAGFFVWCGVTTASWWPAVLPFFGGAAVACVVAALGVLRRTTWGPSFATGLAVIATSILLPAVGRHGIDVFVATQTLVLIALGVRSLADDSVLEPNAWRHSAAALGAGLAVPWLLLTGLFPGQGTTSALFGITGLVLGSIGLWATLRGRTWGLLAAAAAIPPLLAVAPHSWGCMASPHDMAGEAASIALGLAVLPWIGPVAKAVRGR